MVTKKQTLNKFKVTELKEIAKEFNIEARGKKGDLVNALAAKLTKDQIFEMRVKLVTPKPVFDIFTHVLVPKHELLTDKEADAVLKQYNCSKTQLPKIRYTDTAVKMLKARPGQILKITRNSPTAGKAVYYRVVV